MPLPKPECNCQPDEDGDIIHDHGDYVCAVEDCPHLCTRTSWLCWEHEQEEERRHRMYDAEMDRRIDERRGK